MSKYLCKKCWIINKENILKDWTCDMYWEKPVMQLEKFLIDTLSRQLCDNLLEIFLNELKHIAKNTKLMTDLNGLCNFEWYVQKLQIPLKIKK